MLKKLLIIIVLIILAIILFSLGKQIVDSLQSGDRVSAEERKLAELQQKNEDLKARLAEVNSLPFLESQARDKFNLARPNETVVVIPAAEIERVLNASKPPAEPKMPNWQGWLNLFFKQ